PAAAVGPRIEQRLDLLFGGVVQLVPAAVEELDPVVLGRVVRGGHDDAEVEAQQSDGGCRQHAAENRVGTGGHDAARKRLLELGPGGARVATDEDSLRAAPERRGPTDTLDQVDGQRLADDAA